MPTDRPTRVADSESFLLYVSASPPSMHRGHAAPGARRLDYKATGTGQTRDCRRRRLPGRPRAAVCLYLSIGARQADTDGEHYSVRHGGRQPTIQHSRSADLQWGPAVKNDEMTEAAMNAVNGTKRSTITACYTVRIQLEQTRPDARKCRQQQRVYSLHWIE